MDSNTKKNIDSLLSKTRIRNNELFEEIQLFLIKEYNAKEQHFNESSPYGQILKVQSELSKLYFFYLEDALNERNIDTAYKQKSIRGLSRLTGHNPHRGTSAQGEISLKFKSGVSSDINVTNIELKNHTQLLCNNNSLIYLLELNSDVVYLPKPSNEFFNFKIIEGEYTTIDYVSDGSELQSFSINERTELIEHNHVKVFVNDVEYTNFESLYEMNKGDKGCIIKTGLNNSVDIFFGNNDYGTVPQIGTKVTIKYLKTTGTRGNINANLNEIDFEFIDDITVNNDVINLNDIFDISVTQKITLGSDGEHNDLTKQLMNKNHRGLVLATPKNYEYFLKKFNQFSTVYAYNTKDDDNVQDDNVIYLLLIPNINNKLGISKDYFYTSIENFILDDNEKQQIYNVVNRSNQQLMTSELKIVDMTIKRYILNIFVDVFDNIHSEELIRTEIITHVSDYLVQNKRRDKIPKSDIIALIENISGVDSVSVEFISEENETAIRNGYYYKTISYKDTHKTLINDLRDNGLDKVTTPKLSRTEKIIVDSDLKLGLNEFGDIVTKDNELAVIRGGFYDRNDVFFEDDLKSDVLSSLNIVFS